jgi:predicted DNA binding protein
LAFKIRVSQRRFTLKLVEATIVTYLHKSWVSAITERYQARLKLLQSKPSEKLDEVLQQFEITIDDKLKNRLIRYLQSRPDISELAITNSSSGRVTGLIRVKGVVSRCIADSDCFLLYASNNPDTTMVWRVFGPESSFKHLLARFERRGIEYKIMDTTVVSSKRKVTARQEWILHLAFQEGYFDNPKTTHIRSLAKLAGITPPALHESLRKTERKIIEEHLRNA